MVMVPSNNGQNVSITQFLWRSIVASWRVAYGRENDIKRQCIAIHSDGGCGRQLAGTRTLDARQMFEYGIENSVEYGGDTNETAGLGVMK